MKNHSPEFWAIIDVDILLDLFFIRQVPYRSPKIVEVALAKKLASLFKYYCRVHSLAC